VRTTDVLFIPEGALVVKAAFLEKEHVLRVVAALSTCLR
jgi:hypothetical protein